MYSSALFQLFICFSYKSTSTSNSLHSLSLFNIYITVHHFMKYFTTDRSYSICRHPCFQQINLSAITKIHISQHSTDQSFSYNKNPHFTTFTIYYHVFLYYHTLHSTEYLKYHINPNKCLALINAPCLFSEIIFCKNSCLLL